MSSDPRTSEQDKRWRYLSAEFSPDDLDWWLRHPYDTSTGGVLSPWHRVPELQRKLYSAEALTDHGGVVASELHELQESLRSFQQGLKARLQPELPITVVDSNEPLGRAASSIEVADTLPDIPSGDRRRSKRRPLVIVAVCAGLVSIVALTTQLIPRNEVGLEVFDRPQVTSDATVINYETRGTIVEIPESNLIVTASTRLLGERSGFSFFAARTWDGGVCLITERRTGGGEITCVSEREFVDKGISAEAIGSVRVEDRSSGFKDGDAPYIEWTNHQPPSFGTSPTGAP